MTRDVRAVHRPGPDDGHARRDAIVALVGESASSTISDSEALASLGIDLEEVKRRLEASFGPNALPSPDRPPFTPRARDALMRAVTESEAMYHGYVGTEHILLGLIADEGGLAHAILQARGIDFDALRTSILELAAGDYLRMKAADAKLDQLTMLAVPDHYDVFADIGKARVKEIEARTSAMKVFLDEYEAAIANAEAELAARGLTLKT